MVGDGELGIRLRQARQERGLSLRAVAGHAGISPSLLSQVENGKTQPSVSTLYAIVTCLDISIDRVLGNVPSQRAELASDRPEAGGAVQRREDAPTIEMQNGVTWERMATGGFADVDSHHTIYAPGAASSVDGRYMRHSGVEYGYLIEGELTLKLDFDSYTLRAGDSLCFESQRPHLYVNESGAMARGLWMVLGDAPRNLERPPVSTATNHPVTSIVDAMEAFGPRSGARLP